MNHKILAIAIAFNTLIGAVLGQDMRKGSPPQADSSPPNRASTAGVAVPSSQPTGVEQTAPTSDSPTLAPDKSRIAFVSSLAQNLGIWLINIDGSNLRSLVADTTTTNREPAWSPDGSQIAFSSDRSGTVDLWT